MRVLLMIMTLTVLTILHSSHFDREVVYLEASNKPFNVIPEERWTT